MFYLSTLEIAIRLGVAILAGGMVGFEREKKGRDAGFRTHILVAVGACMFALIELESASAMLNLAAANENASKILTLSVHRLTAQVVSGIGFLGAGTIMLTKRSIKGLTTAASIWVCAALGIAVGMGYYLIAGLGALVILLTLVAVKRLFSFPHMKKLSVSYVGSEDYNPVIENHLREHRIRILGVDAKTTLGEGKLTHETEYHVDARHLTDETAFLQQIYDLGPFRQVLMQDMGDDL